MGTTRHKPGLGIRGRQRGAVLLLVTFSLIALLGFAALALDIGRMYIIKSQLQNAADAGALRAALELNGTEEGVWRAGKPGYPCKAGSTAPCGVVGALTNRHLLATGDLLNTEVIVKVADYPYNADDARWKDPASASGANNYYYALVIVEKSGITSLFAGVLGNWGSAARALAIAGRYSPQGKMLPLFVPIVRRNGHLENVGGTWQLNTSWAGSQVAGLTTADCKGETYDPSSKGYKTTCPDHSSLTGNQDKQFRGPDPSGDWGFLRPGQTFASKYLAATGQALPSTAATGYYDNLLNSSGGQAFDTGSYYIIKPEANLKNFNLWAVPAAWTGNFGWTLSDPPSTQQKTLLEAVCRGSVKKVYPTPGCADLHPGGLSDPQFVEVINTRFNEYPANDPDVTPALCPSDKVITEYAAPPPSDYDVYKNDPGTVASGATGRRLIRVYVVDNVWLSGYNDPVSQDDGCQNPLTGGSMPAHIVGCAEFFIYQKSNKSNGLLFAEFVRRVPDNECIQGSGAATFNEVRLYR